MSKIERFEDLRIWQDAGGLVKSIYEQTKKNPFAKDFGLRDQIQRASVSVMSNIAEGFERGSKVEFMQFLFVAKGSCGEVRSLLYVAFEQRYIDETIFNSLRESTMAIGKGISKLITYLKETKIKGQKFQPTGNIKEV